jgi:DNA-binding NarL/FixJ family response regulator
MAKKIKIAVVDDHHLFRQGLIGLLNHYDGLKVIFEASNGKELLGQLKKQQPHIVLLDMQMPYLNGQEATVEIRKLYPDVKIIMITMHTDEALIFDLMKKGVNGFLTKEKSVDQVIEAIYSVREKGFYYTEEVTKAMLSGVRNKQKIKTSLSASSLSEREIEIIKLICQQYSLKDIAEQLKLSPRTVETHKENILAKTGSKNIVGIVLYAVEHRLL